MKAYVSLFLTFLKVGTFTFGGGLAMLPVIKNEVVDCHGWLDDTEIADCFAIAQSLPGILAVNSAIYVGNRVKGTVGAFSAAAGVILPAFVSIIIVLVFLGTIGDNKYIQGAFEGIKAVTVGMILATVISMARNIIHGKLELMIAAVSFALIVVFKASAVWAILFGGLAGLAAYLLKRRSGS